MKSQYLVVDTAALVTHVPLWEYSERLCSVPEVIGEIRDKEARQRLEALPFPVTVRQPQPHSIKFVNEFSKKTGDYASLSLADIKVLALTYELEVEAEGGADHLRTEPLKVVTQGAATKATRATRGHNFNDPPEQCEGVPCEGKHTPTTPNNPSRDTEATPATPASHPITAHHLKALDMFLLHHSYITGHTPSTWDLTLHQAITKQHPHLSRPTEAQKHRGKDTDTAQHGAPSFPLHHTLPHLRRWVKHIASFVKEEDSVFPSVGQTAEEVLRSIVDQVKEEEEVRAEEEVVGECVSGPDTETEHSVTRGGGTEDTQPGTGDHHTQPCTEEEENVKEETEEDSETESEENIRTEDIENEEERQEHEEEEDNNNDDEGWITCTNIKKHKGKRNIFGSVEEEEEEDKDVKVACITADFAMQNVLKHIGLAVMGVDGRLIKQLKTYILRCHACFRTTSIMEKIFCPHCGNKTLKKVSVTLEPDGTQRIWINTKRPISKRGTKFSLPTPKGGKHGRNPLLVADQREAKKYSSRMSKKKNPMHEDYNPADQTPFAVRDVYSRAAQLGYIAGKYHHHFYWEKRNPNESKKSIGKK